jgi:hypothetical protein
MTVCRPCRSASDLITGRESIGKESGRLGGCHPQRPAHSGRANPAGRKASGLRKRIRIITPNKWTSGPERPLIAATENVMKYNSILKPHNLLKCCLLVLLSIAVHLPRAQAIGVISAEKIVVSAVLTNGQPAEVLVMNPDGSGVETLTADFAQTAFDPYLSPDGRWIAFRSIIGTTNEIWVMRADGSAKFKLPLASEPYGPTPTGWLDNTTLLYYSGPSAV